MNIIRCILNKINKLSYNPFVYSTIVLTTLTILDYFKFHYDIRVACFLLLISVYLIRKIDSVKESDSLSRLVNIILILILVAPISVYGLSIIMKSIFKIFNVPIISDSNAWISFYGSILGGAITLFAVMFTLSFEREKGKKDKALSLLPTIEVSHEYMEKSNEFADEYTKLTNTIKNIEETFGTSAVILIKPITSIYKITNTSKNIIRDLKIVTAKIIIENNEYKLYPIYKNEIPNIILDNQVCMFDILVNAIINSIKDDPIVNTKNYIDFKIIIQIEYYDINKTFNIPYGHNFISEGFIDFKGDKFKDSKKKSELIDSGKLEYMKDYSIGSKESYNKLDLTIFDEN